MADWVAPGTIRELTSDGTQVEVPKHFGKYSYVRTIGTGSMSVVCLVREGRSDRLYAAKCVSRSILDREERLECFERELRLLQFLRHPGIIHLYDVVYEKDLIILVMEYCSNGDLFDFVFNRPALPIPMIRSFLYQILKAVEFLHARVYAHRDLKPENIFIDSEFKLKVGDLGLARGKGPRSHLMSTICGTMNYSSPEVFMQNRYDGQKLDIWSIGIIAYVLASNCLPWKAKNMPELSNEITTEEIHFPTVFPSHLATIIRSCTRFEPTERPTVAQILEMQWIRDEKAAYDKIFAPTRNTCSMARFVPLLHHNTEPQKIRFLRRERKIA
jgi:serine/threonine protein kinase